MQLEHSFSVPIGIDEAFRILRDVERIAPCMPGATVDTVEGDTFSGKVKVKVGPIQVTYAGDAKFVEVDEQQHRAVIEAKGKEIRGAGTAQATITTELQEQGGETAVRVTTDLAITGRPAQFGRGVMADVGDKLLGQFAECLSQEVVRPQEPEPAAAPAAAEGGAAAAGGGAAAAAREERPRPSAEAIDLLDIAGASVAKRALPAVVGLALVALLIWWLRRR